MLYIYFVFTYLVSKELLKQVMCFQTTDKALTSLSLQVLMTRNGVIVYFALYIHYSVLRAIVRY